MGILDRVGDILGSQINDLQRQVTGSADRARIRNDLQDVVRAKIYECVDGMSNEGIEALCEIVAQDYSYFSDRYGIRMQEIVKAWLDGRSMMLWASGLRGKNPDAFLRAFGAGLGDIFVELSQIENFEAFTKAENGILGIGIPNQIAEMFAGAVRETAEKRMRQKFEGKKLREIMELTGVESSETPIFAFFWAEQYVKLSEKKGKKISADRVLNHYDKEMTPFLSQIYAKILWEKYGTGHEIEEEKSVTWLDGTICKCWVENGAYREFRTSFPVNTPKELALIDEKCLFYCPVDEILFYRDESDYYRNGRSTGNVNARKTVLCMRNAKREYAAEAKALFAEFFPDKDYDTIKEEQRQAYVDQRFRELTEEEQARKDGRTPVYSRQEDSFVPGVDLPERIQTEDDQIEETQIEETPLLDQAALDALEAEMDAPHRDSSENAGDDGKMQEGSEEGAKEGVKEGVKEGTDTMGDLVTRLQKLEQLKASGLISEEEYSKKRAEILDSI